VALGRADGGAPPQPAISAITTPSNQIIRRIRLMLAATRR
jgi:hypothetical protein